MIMGTQNESGNKACFFLCVCVQHELKIPKQCWWVCVFVQLELRMPKLLNYIFLKGQ